MSRLQNTVRDETSCQRHGPRRAAALAAPAARAHASVALAMLRDSTRP